MPPCSEYRSECRSEGWSAGDAKLDAHLRGADFFDVDNHPEIIFAVRRHRHPGCRIRRGPGRVRPRAELNGHDARPGHGHRQYHAPLHAHDSLT
ncbi:YceI family protein [Streptomyces sp. NBC_01485]|uniref:YceI family protein n=1 Tax=Streptomyces sp. NBC_01485 TaxID=2903884 RepID=UPI003FCC568E